MILKYERFSPSPTYNSESGRKKDPFNSIGGFIQFPAKRRGNQVVIEVHQLRWDRERPKNTDFNRFYRT